jgi:glycopeptide antibiotics resistance protein
VSGEGRTNFLRALLAAYLLGLVMVVWTPVSEESGALLGLFLIEGNLERFLNILLLSPLSVLLKLSFIRTPSSLLLLVGPLLSMTIEIVQIFVPGRIFDLIDVALNSLGFLVVAFFAVRRLR